MTENKCSKNDRRTKRQKTAVSVLIAIILLAAVAVLVACIGAGNDAFYDWLQSTDVSQIRQIAVLKAPTTSNLSYLAADITEIVDGETTGKAELIDILHGLRRSDLKLGSSEYDGASIGALTLKTEDGTGGAIRKIVFNLMEDGSIEVYSDPETDKILYSTSDVGKAWWIDSPELADFIDRMAGRKAPEMEQEMMSLLQVVSAENCIIDGEAPEEVDRKEITDYLNRLGKEGVAVKMMESMQDFRFLRLSLAETENGSWKWIEIGRSPQQEDVVCVKCGTSEESDIEFGLLYFQDENLNH